LKRVTNLCGVFRRLPSACFDAGKAALLVARMAFGVPAWADGPAAAQLKQLPPEQLAARCERFIQKGQARIGRQLHRNFFALRGAGISFRQHNFGMLKCVAI
jgi:hypothetical protein